MKSHYSVYLDDVILFSGLTNEQAMAIAKQTNPVLKIKKEG
jgi:hypothetical protein